MFFLTAVGAEPTYRPCIVRIYLVLFFLYLPLQISITGRARHFCREIFRLKPLSALSYNMSRNEDMVYIILKESRHDSEWNKKVSVPR